MKSVLLLFFIAGMIFHFVCYQVTDHKGTAMSCSRPSDEQASGAVLSATLILYGTYRPRRAAHGT